MSSRARRNQGGPISFYSQVVVQLQPRTEADAHIGEPSVPNEVVPILDHREALVPGIISDQLLAGALSLQSLALVGNLACFV